MRHHFREHESEANVKPPTACPVCKSRELTTTSKTITSATYWRCTTCGEVWNAARVESANRFMPHYR